MKTLTRSETYRRRRQRVARRRKDAPRSQWRPVPPSCAALGDGCLFRNGARLEFREAMRYLARKVRCYDSVVGLLYRCRGQSVDVHVVASRPMTAPVSVLADAWKAEMSQRHPAFLWQVDVSSSPPEASDQYSCVYWCQV